MRREMPGPDDPVVPMEMWPVSLRKDWATKAFGYWTTNWADDRSERPTPATPEPPTDWSDAT